MVSDATTIPPTKVIHCDCDCFYAAVEMRDDPSLVGRPLAVGGSADQRGVVATCNYEARAFGVHSAMATAQALRKCPQLIVVRPAMEKYRVASRLILAIYRDYSPLVEPLSLDEAFLDVTDATHFNGSATRIARAIKARVKDEVGITVSAGAAPNKFLAKIASDWNKPDGLFVIRPDEIDAFVAALPVEKLHGVGAVTARKMRSAGLLTCAQVRERSRTELRILLGALGDRLYDLSRGIDRRRVSPDQERKSLSVEETYVTDLQTLASCERELDLLTARLAEQSLRLRSHEAIESLFVKIRFDDFRKTTVERRAQVVDGALLRTLLAEGFERSRRSVRLLGVGARITRASQSTQIKLFGDTPEF